MDEKFIFCVGLFALLLISMPFVALFSFAESKKTEMETLFIEENYKETINYDDFISIDRNKSEIMYLKDGSYLTMKYEWSADDFDVKDGIQIYIDSTGRVGIR